MVNIIVIGKWIMPLVFHHHLDCRLRIKPRQKLRQPINFKQLNQPEKPKNEAEIQLHVVPLLKVVNVKNGNLIKTEFHRLQNLKILYKIVTPSTGPLRDLALGQNLRFLPLSFWEMLKIQKEICFSRCYDMHWLSKAIFWGIWARWTLHVRVSVHLSFRGSMHQRWNHIKTFACSSYFSWSSWSRTIRR